MKTTTLTQPLSFIEAARALERGECVGIRPGRNTNYLHSPGSELIWNESQCGTCRLAQFTTDKWFLVVGQPKVNWSVLPAWARFVAMDNDGQWCWFPARPEQHEDEKWVFDDPDDTSMDDFYGYIPASHAPTFSGDWKDSLIERPTT
jgi:hypothetical protein